MKIAIIGCGTIGSSMAARWSPTHKIALYDRTFSKAQNLAEAIQAKAFSSATEAIAGRKVILLAVKPQNLAEASELIYKSLQSDQLLASVLAGITLESLTKYFPNAQIIRVMPNIALRYGQGVIGLSDYEPLIPFTKDEIQKLFLPMGWIHWMKEDKMNALSSLAGSGMAFAAAIIEASVEAALAMGLNAEEGLKIILEMFAGTVTTLQQTGMSPSALKLEVTSPGGTTIAGLLAMEKAGLRAAIMETFLATYQRNNDLGKNHS